MKQLVAVTAVAACLTALQLPDDGNQTASPPEV